MVMVKEIVIYNERLGDRKHVVEPLLTKCNTRFFCLCSSFVKGIMIMMKRMILSSTCLPNRVKVNVSQFIVPPSLAASLYCPVKLKSSLSSLFL
mmetsp:Transcript_34175/g.39326  ORF Transcript_34175/g.39326 Transcript_34175/m.39326 type:complete len:94 (+) Transcript_34175:201-482(+)